MTLPTLPPWLTVRLNVYTVPFVIVAGWIVQLALVGGVMVVPSTYVHAAVLGVVHAHWYFALDPTSLESSSGSNDPVPLSTAAPSSALRTCAPAVCPCTLITPVRAEG
jgi:hypothetical protein